MKKQVLTLKRESLDGPLTRDQLREAADLLVREAMSAPWPEVLELDDDDTYCVHVLQDFCIDISVPVDLGPELLAVMIRDSDTTYYAARLRKAILEAQQLLTRRPLLRLGVRVQRAIDTLMRLAAALPHAAAA
jgi:hypothetical protein